MEVSWKIVGAMAALIVILVVVLAYTFFRLEKKLDRVMKHLKVPDAEEAPAKKEPKGDDVKASTKYA